MDLDGLVTVETTQDGGEEIAVEVHNRARPAAGAGNGGEEAAIEERRKVAIEQPGVQRRTSQRRGRERGTRVLAAEQAFPSFLVEFRQRQPASASWPRQKE